MKLQIGIDGKTYELDVEVLEEDDASRQRAPIARFAPVAQAAAPVAAAAAPAADSAPVNEDKALRSPMAGVVNRVAVAVGQAVAAGDLVVVLEAMKMETNVTALAAGTIKRIAVAQGDGVKLKQVLVEFE